MCSGSNNIPGSSNVSSCRKITWSVIKRISHRHPFTSILGGERSTMQLSKSQGIDFQCSSSRGVKQIPRRLEIIFTISKLAERRSRADTGRPIGNYSSLVSRGAIIAYKAVERTNLKIVVTNFNLSLSPSARDCHLRADGRVIHETSTYV